MVSRIFQWANCKLLFTEQRSVNNNLPILIKPFYPLEIKFLARRIVKVENIYSSLES